MKLNDHIQQYYDIKCMYKTEPLKIDCCIIQSSNALFSECDQIFESYFHCNHIL